MSKKKPKPHKKRPEKIPEVLYHFTSALRYAWIQEDGYLKLTTSNLKPRDDATARLIEVGKRDGVTQMEYWDKNTDYKRVVWLTDNPDPTAHGLGVQEEKLQLRLSIRTENLPIKKWRKFAKENNINHEWQVEIERGRSAGNWYICTETIPVSAIIAVDDMCELAKQNEEQAPI